MQVPSRSRQITMPVPHHSIFLQAGCPSCHPTNSVKALKAECTLWQQKHIFARYDKYYHCFKVVLNKYLLIHVLIESIVKLYILCGFSCGGWWRISCFLGPSALIFFSTWSSLTDIVECLRKARSVGEQLILFLCFSWVELSWLYPFTWCKLVAFCVWDSFWHVLQV